MLCCVALHRQQRLLHLVLCSYTQATAFCTLCCVVIQRRQSLWHIVLVMRNSVLDSVKQRKHNFYCPAFVNLWGFLGLNRHQAEVPEALSV